MIDMNSLRQRARGFTIAELVVVIAVIGILVGLTTLAYTGARDDARYAQAKSEIKDIIQLTRLAAANSGGKTLGRMLEGKGIEDAYFPADGCNNESAIPKYPSFDLPKTSECWVRYLQVLDTISELSKQPIPDSLRDGDPWGSPYWLDTNEGEETVLNGGNECLKDLWGSPGPDGVMFTTDDQKLDENGDKTLEIKSPYIALDYCN